MSSIVEETPRLKLKERLAKLASKYRAARYGAQSSAQVRFSARATPIHHVTVPTS